MRRSVDTPRSVSDAYVTTFTTSPVGGASTTRPWPTNIATCPEESSVPAEPGVGTRSPGVSRDSVVAVVAHLCRRCWLRWWPPAAHAATIRLEQSHAAGPFAPKMSGFPHSPHANITAATAAGDVPARTI